MKLKELLVKGYGNTMDLNCAEKIVYGANWAYDLKLAPESLKLSAGFGVGMGVESVCGALTGAIMVLSHLYVKQNSHESTRMYQSSKSWQIFLRRKNIAFLIVEWNFL